MEISLRCLNILAYSSSTSAVYGMKTGATVLAALVAFDRIFGNSPETAPQFYLNGRDRDFVADILIGVQITN